MNGENLKSFSLDTSAIVHLAVLQDGHANLFRLSSTLDDMVDVDILQNAINKLSNRFPTLVAGIQYKISGYVVTSASQPPKVQPEQEILENMNEQEIQTCAMRILYCKNVISVEFFHALTDGYGAMQFLKALLYEYLNLTQKIEPIHVNGILAIEDKADPLEWEDSCCAHAGKERTVPNYNQSYQMPTDCEQFNTIYTTTIDFSLEEILNKSRSYHVTITTLLTTILVTSIMELQTRQNPRKKRPVSVMVPINLRKYFTSKSLRNFSLYAIPGMNYGEEKGSIHDQLKRIGQQLHEQVSIPHLKGMISNNVSLAENRFIRILPRRMKCCAIRIGHRYFGSKQSSITLSNLGEIQLPEQMAAHVKMIDFVLTPRILSHYNCGVISYDGILRINFSRYCPCERLEPIFIEKCITYGLVPNKIMKGDV